MKRYYYITPKDYERAKANGICKSTLEARVRRNGWDIERAVNEPPLGYPLTEEERAAMKRLGISKKLLSSRVLHRGMTVHEAATTPKTDMKELHRKFFTDEHRQIMKAHGVKYSTALYRVKKAGWTIEEAITTPPMTPQENAANARKSLKKVWKSENDIIFNRGKAQ